MLLTQTQLPLNIQERVSANADANANIIAPRSGWSVVVEKSPVGRASLRKMFAFGSIHQEKTWTTRRCDALRCLPSLLRSTLRCIKKTTESELSLRRREEELTQKMEKEFRLPSPSSKPTSTCKTFKAAEPNFKKGRNSSYTNTRYSFSNLGLVQVYLPQPCSNYRIKSIKNVVSNVEILQRLHRFFHQTSRRAATLSFRV